MDILQLVVSIILFFVLFFGIAFILNMLLRKTWVMSIIYPIVIILIVDKFPFSQYFSSPATAFSTLFTNFTELKISDILILLSGFIGTIVSGIVIKFLRKSGYQMF